MVQNIVAATRHVVHNSVSVDTHTSSSASLNHVTELFARAATTLKLVRNRLIVKPPRVKLSILRPLVRKDGLGNWENFDAHPALLSEVGAFFLDVSVRPAKHLNNTTLLTVFVNSRLVDCSSLPDEVHWFEGDGIVLCAVVRLDRKGESICKGTTDGVRVFGLEALAVPVVLKGGDTLVLTATCCHGGSFSG
jgi:hypothetical protein